MTAEDLHNAVDTICDAWPRASAVTRSLMRARSYDAPIVASSGHSDPTGEAVVEGHAVAWMSELHDVAVIFIEHVPGDPETLRSRWHDLFNAHPTGWSEIAVKRLYRLADDAHVHWPPTPRPPKRGDKVDGVVVGDGRMLANETEKCAACGAVLPAVRGARRFIPDANGGGDWVCKSPCWYTVTTSRGIHPRQQATAS